MSQIAAAMPACWARTIGIERPGITLVHRVPQPYRAIPSERQRITTLRVGITQSNRSDAAKYPLSKSIGRPTPIRYRGRSSGNAGPTWVEHFVHLAGDPDAQTADRIPGKSSWRNCSVHQIRASMFESTLHNGELGLIGARFPADRLRSAQRTVRSHGP